MDKPMKMGVASDGRPMHYSVGAFIEDGAGEYLLFNRRFEPLGYASMAGHIDEGVTDPEQMLREEGFEELGVELLDLEFILEEEVPWNTCWKADVHYWYLFRARVNRSLVRVDPHESKDAGKWYWPAEIKALTLEPVWKYWFEKQKII